MSDCKEYREHKKERVYNYNEGCYICEHSINCDNCYNWFIKNI